MDGLSRGMKQRLCLARALIHDPDLLILDEPASGLDPRTRVEYTAILKELRDQGKTLLVSSHIYRNCQSFVPRSASLSREERSCRAAWIRFCADQLVQSASDLDFQPERKALAILKAILACRRLRCRGMRSSWAFWGIGRMRRCFCKQLIDADVMVSSFMREKGSLESLFMQITGHEEERAVLKHEMESGI